MKYEEAHVCLLEFGLRLQIAIRDGFQQIGSRPQTLKAMFEYVYERRVEQNAVNNT